MYAIIFDYSHKIDESMTEVEVQPELIKQPVKVSRVERKRQEARARIVDAAQKLMRNGNVDEVTIQDITHAADVGHGSFYLHFKSKHDVLMPIMVAEAAKLDRKLQRSLRDCKDPAEVLGLSARYMGYTLAGDPLWRWFLNHSGVPSEDVRAAFGAFSERDVKAGLISGRFKPLDAKVSLIFGFGGFVSVLLASFKAAEPERLIDMAVATLLITLGVSSTDAEPIAKKSITHIK